MIDCPPYVGDRCFCLQFSFSFVAINITNFSVKIDYGYFTVYKRLFLSAALRLITRKHPERAHKRGPNDFLTAQCPVNRNLNRAVWKKKSLTYYIRTAQIHFLHNSGENSL